MMGTFLYLTIALLSCVVFATAVDEEQSHSTSIAEMEKLLYLEAKFIKRLSEYANELENKLKVVRG